MGTGTEVAIQSAGITLVKGDLAGIARARTLSRPVVAALAMAQSSVISNALRLRTVKLSSSAPKIDKGS